MHTGGVCAHTHVWSGSGIRDSKGEELPTPRSYPAWEALVKLCLQDSLVTREHEAKVPLSNRHRKQETI